ncbi:ABC transporter ATP-binding protein [Alkalilimnicola ehrlichii MLHE-1]|uniref:ABC transporter related protein n=1 Tax=Alkalilimnicola ehrlichii (strain ATCC BAA-1101 / DSM 17681 / MLHE-1) TaxID=187272 RepID=Q0A6P8_ALKEH|nr:ABC transporter ATP-binding protein [Alkalilimnicola ehrlichii]ABI57489.1 ABC transporter related protein [Alkalilimnicola ehrlichii MLHE-1]
MSIVLELAHVAKSFSVGGHRVSPLIDANLVVRRGDLVSIVGPSGSGKSTLLHVLGCLERPDQGEVYIRGRPTRDLSDEELSAFRGKTLGFVFQRFYLIDRMTALQNVAMPLEYRDDLTREEAWARAWESLERVGLAEHAHHRPRQLSGGQQQRVAIARALASHPTVLLLDEPTGNLDPDTGRSIMRIIHELRQVIPEMAVILVTHDMALAADAEIAYELHRGRLHRVHWDQAGPGVQTISASCPA